MVIAGRLNKDSMPYSTPSVHLVPHHQFASRVTGEGGGGEGAQLRLAQDVMEAALPHRRPQSCSLTQSEAHELVAVHPAGLMAIVELRPGHHT